VTIVVRIDDRHAPERAGLHQAVRFGIYIGGKLRKRLLAVLNEIAGCPI
jgi:hypothetical protein